MYFCVGGEQINAIGRGICVLLGISLEDTQKELEHMVRKILNLRVFEDESGKHWSKSVMDKQYEVLCVSQFTLQCVLKGNKPDFHLAMPTEQAESFYNSFLEQLRKTYRPEFIKDGKFGAYMQVHIQNDGPVTIELESSAPGATTSDPKQRMQEEYIDNQPISVWLYLPCVHWYHGARPRSDHRDTVRNKGKAWHSRSQRLGEEQGARSSPRNFHVINISTFVSATPGEHRDEAGDTVSLISMGKKDN
ncbi:D-aminoacyl-tRNA deacylase 1 isoform X2 [Pteropus medius]|uniref:D-aminoacyl-tRNA deacylase 1 isoform X2 n=1 Tax=Pteropus vampyrus TaxID=132908 RepID=UPI00196A4DBC|nr:D-aminoacyl-tRNA deacylase 1 isoform X2 [Pteropus giganteus]